MDILGGQARRRRARPAPASSYPDPPFSRSYDHLPVPEPPHWRSDSAPNSRSYQAASYTVALPGDYPSDLYPFSGLDFEDPFADLAKPPKPAKRTRRVSSIQSETPASTGAADTALESRVAKLNESEVGRDELDLDVDEPCSADLPLLSDPSKQAASRPGTPPTPTGLDTCTISKHQAGNRVGFKGAIEAEAEPNGIAEELSGAKENKSHGLENDETEKRQSSVRYRAIFFDKSGKELHASSQDEPILVSSKQEAVGLVFDVVTEYQCLPLGSDRYSAERYIDEQRVYCNAPGNPGGPPVYSLDRYVTIKSMQGTRRLDIHSASILHAIRSVVRYWPALNLASSSLKLYEPYGLLIQYADEINTYIQQHPPGDTSEICEQRKDAAEHLSLLENYLSINITPAVVQERARHTLGRATFDNLWLLFKPGTDVIVTIEDHSSTTATPELRGYVVESIELGMGSHRYGARKAWSVALWGLHYDGTCVGRTSRKVSIEEFEGEIEVTTMRIVPAGWPGHMVNGTPRVEILKANGQKAFGLLRPQCLHHSGKAQEFPYNNVDGLVMIDMKTFYVDNPDERPKLRPEEPKSIDVSSCYCPICVKAGKQHATQTQGRREPYEGYGNITTDTEALTDHQSFLFPGRLFAFHFRTRAWEMVDVHDLGPARFRPDILNTLVMKSGRIEMLKALSRKYVRSDAEKHGRSNEFWSADFIDGKGKSQIILLHGKPGVGKTYTAECIAEHTRRPLMSLTCADIGTKAQEVEENLEYHFTAARDWGAFVLIDEADIYMERRSSSDLERNSLVPSFLRALESYEGILFLTTNRVGAFDDAFVSRMHVKLYYPPLEEEDRQQIWTAFINKLSHERSKDMRVTLGAKEYIRGSGMRSLDLNGREIRNAFQTAVALAEFEQKRDEEGKIMVEDHHIEQVAEMSRDFQRYLDELHHGNEEKRAARAYERHDKWTDVRGKGSEKEAQQGMTARRG